MADIPITRRTMLGRIGAAAGVAAVGAQGAILVRSLVPDVSYDPPSTVKIGRPDTFANGITFLADHRLFIARDGRSFRALSAVCTHLGCTVRAEALDRADASDPSGQRQIQVHEFSCPCHGSRYAGDGANLSGPAPRPLLAYRLTVAQDDGQLVVDLRDEVARTFALGLP
jgi:cytochrome b6-f complex iron-sulfur subunit